MQKSDVPRLLTRLLQGPIPRGKVLAVVSDESLFARVMPLFLERACDKSMRPLRFTGKAPALAFLEHASQGGMFAEPAPCLVHWEDKLTAKQWEAEAAVLRRLPAPVPITCAFLFPLAFRTVVKEQDFPWLDLSLCWGPAEPEALRAADMLHQRFAKLAGIAPAMRQTQVTQAVEHYSGDLAQVDAHFQRMNDTSLAFEDCFAGGGDVGGFEVADALARGDTARLFLRLRQCQEAGENPGAVLMAVSYFLRQVVQVHGSLEGQGPRKDIRAALDDAHVPFPSQARVQSALSALPLDPLLRFFAHAAPLETTLRTHRDPFGLLAVELSALLV